MTDYKKLAAENQCRYGTDKIIPKILRQLYGDDTHFVYELVQNAEDSKSQHIEFRLAEDALLVWNDGCRFREQDVRGICSIGMSDKDLTQIGNFGIGFKAVYSYTELPEIYSGDERFRIRDSTKPESVDDGVPSVKALVVEGKTVFRLPFKKHLRPEDIDLLRNRLRNLEKRALLFLRYLETVHWRDEREGQTGAYIRHCQPHDTVQNASQVELKVSTTGEEQASETFLVFRKEVQPPQEGIDKLLLQVEDDEERQRLQRKAGAQQPVEVAFRLQDRRITPMNGCVLFAYLPTEKETHLRFIIQARYQTKLARDNIPTHHPWNAWLVQETASFLPDILEQLKAGDLLEPTFFNVLPLEEDNVPAEFAPIAAALQQAMKERPLVPTEGNGYAKAENVFYPHAESLQNLVKCSCIHPNSSWLHPHIRDTEEFRRCFKVMREAGVRELSVSQVLRWFEGQSPDWFAGKPVEWLRALYAYLNQQKSELARIKKLPLVRLENGQHVCARAQLVFFPPDTDEAREEIAPFISELPILQSALLEIDCDEHDDMKAFLGKLGVRPLSTEAMISEWILPKYLQDDNPSVAQNRLHVRYLFGVWDNLSDKDRVSLRKEIDQTPILRVYRGNERETSKFVVPCKAYLPKAYTGDADLETYFSACDNDVWFVDGRYLENDDAKAWLRFLKAICAMDTPKVEKFSVPVNQHELDVRNLKLQYSTREATIEDSNLDGLAEGLTKISNHGQVKFSRVLWRLLVKVIKAFPSDHGKRKDFFQGTYRGLYRSAHPASFDAAFYRQLKETAWIPDEQGNLRLPSECFAPTPENRQLLGDSVAYLHPECDFSDEAARWLAEELGVHLKANIESVLNHLQELSGTTVSIRDIEPLYRFLEQRQRARLGERFREKSLIFAPNPEPHWWRTDEVFWENEDVVFGNARGYLSEHYPETLKRFFTALGVSERASPVDYVRRIQEVASGEDAGDAKVHERVKTLYLGLWQSFDQRQHARPRERFQEKSLIFAPNPEPRWWRADEVFWEDESAVFGDNRGYLKNHYPEMLKPFFTALGVSERAARLDYVRCILEVASDGRADDAEVRERVKILYLRLRPFLQEGGSWIEDDKWEQARDGECWLGKQGDEWGFFLATELVWDDHAYLAELFKGEVPFWPFPDLLEFAKHLEVEPCSQAQVQFDTSGDQEKYADLSEKVQNLRADIQVFFESPLLCGADKSAEVLDSVSVCLTEELTVTYTLKGTPVTDQENPRQSFLDTTGHAATLWLGLGADEDEYAELIGDALQEYFDVKELRGFVEDLLTKNRGKVLARWKQRGLRADLCASPSEPDREDAEEPTKTLEETESEYAEPKAEPSAPQTPQTESTDSAEDESEPSTDFPPRDPGRTSSPGGQRRSVTGGGSSHYPRSKPNQSGGSHRRGGGGGEGPAHLNLKTYLADNPSQLGAGLESGDIEYTFQSNDRVDILFEDNSGNPVTVEVETHIPPGNYVGVWQAVKYKHLAAVEYDIPCEQVRSILAAPVIPDDVKQECKRLKIEPVEVDYP